MGVILGYCGFEMGNEWFELFDGDVGWCFVVNVDEVEVLFFDDFVLFVGFDFGIECVEVVLNLFVVFVGKDMEVVEFIVFVIERDVEIEF